MRQKLKRQQGFTIIEVMIVLAIAGLIMLIVFLAVPALQRTSRNTQRKNDAGNILGAVGTYVSNNNGALPNSQGALNNLLQSIKLGYYNTNGTVDVIYSKTTPTPCTTVGTTSCPNSSYVNTEDVYFLPGFTCNSSNQPSANGSNRGYAVVYEVETGPSSSAEQCTAS